MLIDNLPVQYNVRVSTLRDGKVVDRRESHNVMTNAGRAWLATLVGASAYPTPYPTPHTPDRIKYMGLGCGGALQTDVNFLKFQSATVDVTDLEDAVPFQAGPGNTNHYLKQVAPQAFNSTFFPSPYRTRFILEISENEISYVGSATAGSNRTVDTSVPISEAGLYLSSAQSGGLVTPANARTLGSMVCYDTFSPITITPNVMVRVEWELRF